MMLRFRFASFVALPVLALTSSAVLAESFTTRIEPRPFYGAVVTLEEGVRVIRPLPPDRHVIINPNRTPLTIGYNETRIYESRNETTTIKNVGGNAEGQAYGYSGGLPIYGSGHRFSGGRHGGGWSGGISSDGGRRVFMNHSGKHGRIGFAGARGGRVHGGRGRGGH